MDSYTYEAVLETPFLPACFIGVSCPGTTVPAHWHEYLEIVFLLSGRMTAVIQARPCELEAGDVLVINPKDLHMTQTHGSRTNYLLLQISDQRILPFFPDLHVLRLANKIPGNVPFADGGGSPASFLTEMQQIFARKEEGYPLLFTARLYEFLYCLFRNYATREISGSHTAADRDFARIARIMDWVREHYQEPVTLSQAAGHLGLSCEYFCRIFKKYTGQTFLEYVNDVRVMQFYEDMQSSEESITRLMEKHGITNYKVFLRTFKKLYGDTPQKLRSRACVPAGPANVRESGFGTFPANNLPEADKPASAARP